MASSSLMLASYSYNVFFSFHGPDVRNKNILSDIRKLFISKGITMFDDEEMNERGAKITLSLKLKKKKINPLLHNKIKAIRESRISIVILSKKYASSSTCLYELVEILECRKTMGHIVMTIFYEVDPYDVRKLMGEFGIAFDKTCARKTKEEKKIWSKALNEVGNIPGYVSKYWESEAEVIQGIARDVLNELNATPSAPRDLNDMVGLEDHLKEIHSLLDLVNNDGVKIVAIDGPVGIGKSTIARALHAQLANSFQLSCFVENLTEFHKYGLKRHFHFDKYSLKRHLHEQFFSKILDQSGMRISHLGVLEENLREQRVLIILDDVKNRKQLESLANEISWFGLGSRILITTEDNKLLQQHGNNNTYNVEYPSDEDALKILCKYAFKQTSPLHGFRDLAKSVIEVCGKLPLDLRVVGSTLRNKKEDKWEDEVRRWKTREVYPSEVRRRKTSKPIKDVGNRDGEDLLRSTENKETAIDIHDDIVYRRPSRTKVKIEWSLAITYFILEIPSCVLDQISSTDRPSYALAALLLSLLALLVGLMDLLYKGIAEKVVWKWTWEPIPWFYTRRSNMFGSFPEMVGLLCGVCQTILTTINFSFIIRKVDAPIKVSVWPIIFALGVLFNMYVKQNNKRVTQMTEEREMEMRKR